MGLCLCAPICVLSGEMCFAWNILQETFVSFAYLSVIGTIDKITFYTESHKIYTLAINQK
jgi:hypothetical protein